MGKMFRLRLGVAILSGLLALGPSLVPGFGLAQANVASEKKELKNKKKSSKSVKKKSSKKSGPKKAHTKTGKKPGSKVKKSQKVKSNYRPDFPASDRAEPKAKGVGEIPEHLKDDLPPPNSGTLTE